MAYGLTFRLELDDGAPADPPTFRSAPGISWKVGDTIPLGARTLRVVGVRDDEADPQPPALAFSSRKPGRCLRVGNLESPGAPGGG
jgi:hypothetical protein